MVGVSPSSFITESKHIIRPYCKVITVWGPSHTGYYIVIRRTSKEKPSVLIEDFVFAILTTRDYVVIGGIPVNFEDHSIMCFPLDLLLTSLERFYIYHLVSGEQKRISFRNPYNRVYRFIQLDQIGSEVTVPGVYFDGSVFTACDEGVPVLTPSERNDSAFVGFVHMSLNFTGLLLYSQGPVRKPDGQHVINASGTRQEIHVGCTLLQIKKFGTLILKLSSPQENWGPISL